ncbi:MAG: TonB-dependent receptor plug domain-containing protein, partial [Alphaproteobacteria bacterium]
MRFTKYAAVLSLIGGLLFFALPAAAKQDRELQELMNKDIEELVVSVASKREESIYDAPGAVSVVTREEIRKYGALNLHDALRFVPALLPMGSLV